MQVQYRAAHRRGECGEKGAGADFAGLLAVFPRHNCSPRVSGTGCAAADFPQGWERNFDDQLMKIDLKYGRRGLGAELGGEPTVFRTRDMPAVEDPAARLRQCLDRPIGTPPLHEIAAGRKDACIVVSDVTRPVPNKVLLPPIIKELNGAGIPSRRIRLLVATGIHRAPTGEELIEIFGREIPADCPVISHDARDPASVARIGSTSRGTPIEINRNYLESDLKLVVGLVEPHLMAGYSGGRKSVAIGLTSIESVKHLHATKFLEHPDARNCELDNNPLHIELTEIARTAGVDFCVSVAIDASRRIGGIFCGELVQSHRAACEFARRFCTVSVERPFDIVVTTGGGYPLDTTYYQSGKGLVGALGILSPGGSIILASECSHGLGTAEFRRVLEHLHACKDYGEFIERISNPDNFVIDQWGVEMLVKAFRRGKIYLYSPGIPEKDWPLTGATRIGSVEEGLSLATRRSGPAARTAVVPEGPYVIPMVDNTATKTAPLSQDGSNESSYAD